MRQKLFTFFLALVASVSAIYASDTQVDGIWYDFDSSTKTASVTYRGSNYDSYDDEYSYFVSVPDTVTYNGTTYRVTSIGASAFSSCYLTSIIIPNSVMSIGEKAFYNCTSLTYVSIGSGIKTIGEMAFGDCYQLTYITCKAVTPPTLGSNDVFPPNLKTVYIPVDTYSEYWNAWTWIDIVFDLIDYGSRIIYIDVFANDEIMTNTDAFDCLIQNHTYEMGVGVITFSGTLTSIGNNAFKDCEYLRYIELPNTVTSIGNNAFERCGNLSDIELPNTVTSIGEYAFSGCSSLTSITIPNSVTIIGSSTFSSCSSLTSITIPNNVTSIGTFAFAGCSALTSVTIGESVTSIGEEAFCSCSSLTSITIPNSVTYIGPLAFLYCPSLTSMVVEAGNTTFDSRGNCNAIIHTATNTLIAGCQKTVIPNTVTSIEFYAFNGCSSLASITIPNTVTSIGFGAFSGCSSLTSITIPNSVTSIESITFSDCSSLTSITIPNSVTNIGSSAFERCRSLTSITIPNSVTSIESRTFSDCSSLTSITIPNSVTSIGDNAFDGCKGLTSVTIPNSVTSIGDNAFYWCDALTSVTIGSGVTSIGVEAFYNCSSLTSVTIGSGVTNIGKWAFWRCSSLTSITCEATVPPTLGMNIFQFNLKTAYIPCGTKEAYEASDWKQYVAEFIEECEAEQYTRDVTPNKYGTICLPFGSTDFSGATFYEIAYKAPFIIYFDEVTTLEAGKPYVFYAHSNKLVVTSDGTRVNNPLFDNGLYGTFDEIIAAATNILTNNYIVNNNSLCMCGEYCSLPANRAYVKLDEVSSTARALAPGRKRVSLSVQEENTSTALDNISEDTENIPAQKGVYDILGRKMLEPTGIGFYIIDGQKVIIAK